MSSLGFQTVYHLLNSDPAVVCERCFVPDKEDLEELARAGGELLSYESQSPVQTFDVIAFSISYELDYVNVPRILRLAKLPVRAAERGEHHPLVIAGGPITSINPQPLASLIDWCVTGELEPVLGELLSALRARTPWVRQRAYLRDLDAWPTHSGC